MTALHARRCRIGARRGAFGLRSTSQSTIRCWLRNGLLVCLALLPWIAWWSSGLAEHQLVGPGFFGTGTGVDFLAASLVATLVFFLLPSAFGLSSDDNGRTMKQVGAILAAHFLFLAVADFLDRPNDHWIEIFTVASVLIWPPLLCLHLPRFPWPRQCARWLLATGSRAAMLLIGGFITFLPGHSEDGLLATTLVAHAPVAVTGLLICLSVLALRGIGR